MGTLFIAKQFSDMTQYRSRVTGHDYSLTRNPYGYCVESKNASLLFLTKSRAQALHLIELADAHPG
jgi:hypothetical protein